MNFLRKTDASEGGLTNSVTNWANGTADGSEGGVFLGTLDRFSGNLQAVTGGKSRPARKLPHFEEWESQVCVRCWS